MCSTLGVRLLPFLFFSFLSFPFLFFSFLFFSFLFFSFLFFSFLFFSFLFFSFLFFSFLFFSFLFFSFLFFLFFSFVFFSFLLFSFLFFSFQSSTSISKVYVMFVLKFGWLAGILLPSSCKPKLGSTSNNLISKQDHNILAKFEPPLVDWLAYFFPTAAGLNWRPSQCEQGHNVK